MMAARSRRVKLTRAGQRPETTDMSRLAFLLVVCCGWAVARLPAQPPAGSAELTAVAANGYRANLESFEYVTCRYTVTWGFAKSLDDALAGRLEPNARTATAVFYKDGRVIRFRIEEDAASKATLDKPPKPVPAPELGGLKAGPLMPFITLDYLVNGAHGLCFSPHARGANIYDGGTPKGREVDGRFLFTPLGVNTKYDFGLLAEQAAHGETRLTASAATAEGAYEGTFQVTKDLAIEFTIDLNRGSLPTRIEQTHKKGADGISYVVVPDVRACSRGRWFPGRVVTFLKQFPSQSPCGVTDYRVTELDVDHRPPQEALTVELPAGTTICQFDDSRKFFKTRRPERVGSEDLARIQELTEEVPSKPQTDTAIVQPRRYTWVWYAGGGVLGLLILAYLGWRYRAARRQHAPV